MRPLTLSEAVGSFNSWPVISKNRHEFHEFREEDHLTDSAEKT